MHLPSMGCRGGGAQLPFPVQCPAQGGRSNTPALSFLRNRHSSEDVYQPRDCAEASGVLGSGIMPLLVPRKCLGLGTWVTGEARGADAFLPLSAYSKSLGPETQLVIPSQSSTVYPGSHPVRKVCSSVPALGTDILRRHPKPS